MDESEEMTQSERCSNVPLQWNVQTWNLFTGSTGGTHASNSGLPGGRFNSAFYRWT